MGRRMEGKPDRKGVDEKKPEKRFGGTENGGYLCGPLTG